MFDYATPSIGSVTDVFCQIARGEINAAVVARTDELIAFLDHRPVFKGHVLIAPISHVDTLLDLPPELMTPLLTLAQRIAGAIVQALEVQGTFVAMNNVVSQSVPHLHLHVVPRTKGDGLRGFFWPRTRYGAGEIETYARLLADALNSQTGTLGDV
jgi:histidine triad (HIT) family protein